MRIAAVHGLGPGFPSEWGATIIVTFFSALQGRPFSNRLGYTGRAGFEERRITAICGLPREKFDEIKGVVQGIGGCTRDWAA